MDARMDATSGPRAVTAAGGTTASAAVRLGPDAISTPGAAVQRSVLHQQTAAIAAGDRQAFAAFYRDWFPFMYREAQRATGADEATNLDVVHDAMLRVIRRLRAPFNDEAALASWLRKIVYSCACDRLRAETRRRRRETERDGPNAPPSDDSRSGVAIEDALLAERLAWLRDRIASLDEEQNALLAMRYRFNWTLERIGRTLGLTAGAVDGRLARLIAKLRAGAMEEFEE